MPVASARPHSARSEGPAASCSEAAWLCWWIATADAAGWLTWLWLLQLLCFKAVAGKLPPLLCRSSPSFAMPEGNLEVSTCSSPAGLRSRWCQQSAHRRTPQRAL
jgi:hypothetical protein